MSIFALKPQSLAFVLKVFSLMLLVMASYSSFAENTEQNTQSLRQDLQLDVYPEKQIYNSREGLLLKFIFTARSRTKMCLNKDPLSQMQVTVFKAGVGELPLEPLVLTDNTELFKQKTKIQWLEPGENVTLRANLKRYKLAEGRKWEPGEYSVKATFNLCEQTPGPQATVESGEILIHSKGTGSFMIML